MCGLWQALQLDVHPAKDLEQHYDSRGCAHGRAAQVKAWSKATHPPSAHPPLALSALAGPPCSTHPPPPNPADADDACPLGASATHSKSSRRRAGCGRPSTHDARRLASWGRPRRPRTNQKLLSNATKYHLNHAKTSKVEGPKRAEEFSRGDVGLGRGWACTGDKLNYSLILLNTIKTTPKPAQSRAQSVPKSFREGEVGLGRGWACIGDQINGSLIPLNTTNTTPKPAPKVCRLVFERVK